MDKDKNKIKSKDTLMSLKKKTISLRLEDKTYKLRFDLNALAMLEDKYGDIDTAMSFEEGKPIISKMRFMLYAALLAEHPEITEAEVGHMFDMENLMALQSLVGEAMTSALPVESEGEGGQKKAVTEKAK